MANYACMIRSNYVLLKPGMEESFKRWVDDVGAIYISGTRGDGGEGKQSHGFYTDNGEPIPGVLEDENGAEREINLVDDLAPMLEDGEVFVLMEIGYEKVRYFEGRALAFNNRGEYKEVSINDIYDSAKELGTNITRAEY